MTKSNIESIKVTDIDGITVSASVLGNIFGVTDRRIRQMAEEGIVARASKGRYKLVDSLKNYILTLKLTAEGVGLELTDGEINIEEEKALHERVKRHISELKLQVLASFKTKIMGIPSKTAPVLENRDAAYVKDHLTREVVEALSELADYDPRMFYGDEFIESEKEDEVQQD